MLIVIIIIRTLQSCCFYISKVDMEFFYLLASIVLILFGSWYLYAWQKFSYWTKRGLSGPTVLPLLGHALEQYWKGQHTMEQEWVQKYGKVYGTYEGYEPTLSIADPELIKQITIKDFHLFINRNKVDEHMRQLIFFMEGENWKRVRAITSPAFTSGKLRSMKTMMNANIDKLSGFFMKLSKMPETNFDTKKVVSGFTIDVISSTFFGTETNANGDQEKEHPLVRNGMAIFEHQASLSKVLLEKLFPKKFLLLLSYAFGNSGAAGSMFIGKMLATIIAQRRATNVTRNDFVQLLIEASVSESELSSSGYEHLAASFDDDDENIPIPKQSNANCQPNQTKVVKQLNDPEIRAQMMIFFLGGFETTATTISHCLFELAANQDIQDKLYNELNETLHDLEPNGDLFYETVMTKIAYLDAVIKETLRKYPPLTRIERRVGQDNYNLGGVTLAKDQMVYISVYAVHHNEDYYPEPSRFNPERFMPENKHLLTPYTYLPFGQGPRNCIGMRFAYQEIKLCLAKIIQKFRFTLPENAPRKLDFQRFNIASAMPFQLNVAQRH